MPRRGPHHDDERRSSRRHAMRAHSARKAAKTCRVSVNSWPSRIIGSITSARDDAGAQQRRAPAAGTAGLLEARRMPRKAQKNGSFGGAY